MSKKNKSTLPEYYDQKTATYLGASWLPNKIRDTADAYLEAAQVMSDRKQKNTGNFWEVSSWFVVHHLSYISSEIYLKSFASYSVYLVEDSPIDPDTEPYEVSCYVEEKESEPKMYRILGHGDIFDKLLPEVRSHLEKTLCSGQMDLIRGMKDSELSRGRYPYETENKEGVSEKFPSGEEAQKLATKWLDLARSLSEITIPVEIPE